MSWLVFVLDAVFRTVRPRLLRDVRKEGSITNGTSEDGATRHTAVMCMKATSCEVRVRGMSLPTKAKCERIEMGLTDDVLSNGCHSSTTYVSLSRAPFCLAAAPYRRQPTLPSITLLAARACMGRETSVMIARACTGVVAQWLYVCKAGVCSLCWLSA